MDLKATTMKKRASETTMGRERESALCRSAEDTEDKAVFI
jgi:hypothetical protein